MTEKHKTTPAPAPPLPTGPATIGLDTKARIVAAASRLLPASGGAASLRDIAKAAGVSLGAYARHFTGRDELAGAVFCEHCSRVAAALDERLLGLDAAETLERGIRVIAERSCALFESDRALFGWLLLTQHEHIRLAPPTMATPAKTVYGLIDRCTARGELPLDPHGFGTAQTTALRTAAAMGVLLQPAVLRTYGDLAIDLNTAAAHLAAAACAAVRAI